MTYGEKEAYLFKFYLLSSSPETVAGALVKELSMELDS